MGQPRNALRMAPLRSLLVLLIFAGLIGAATAVAEAPVEWYSDPSGGGAMTGPAPQSNSAGGALAPAYTTPIPTGPPQVNLPPPSEVPASDSPPARAAGVLGTSARGPRADGAVAGGGKAAGGRAPGEADGGDEAGGDAAAEVATTARGATARVAAQPLSADSGPLRFTGWELAALALAGLCLLVGGAALRPRAARR